MNEQKIECVRCGATKSDPDYKDVRFVKTDRGVHCEFCLEDLE